MTDSDTTNNPAKPGVFHNKTETIHTDTEKVVAAFAPLIEHLKPLFEAWKSSEVEKAQAAESGFTKRQWANSITLIAVVVAVCWLAYAAIGAKEPAIAEKIVIGLLAFLGGFGARR